jgi:hypothetical protein
MPMRRLLLVCVATVTSFLSGCGDDAGQATTGSGGGSGGASGQSTSTGAGGEGAIPEGCNPLSPADCLVPYPSDFFLDVDGAMPSGRRVVIPPVAQVPFDEQPVDLLTLHPADGFSPLAPILALFPEGVDPSALPAWNDDDGVSLGDDSPTVIVDTETGERVPHFAELDPRAIEDARRALVLRPLVRLERQRRYVVGIKGLVTPSGSPVAAPSGFAALRDAATVATPSALAELGARYDTDVFPVLEDIAPRASWQLGWDFTTASDANIEADMLGMRAELLDALEEPPAFTIDEVIPAPADHVALRIDGTMTVPLFLDAPEPGNLLHRDDGGRVTANGTTEVGFSVWIPPSVAEREPGAAPARLFQYGHGFFGTRNEVTGSQMRLADEEGFVVVATEWWGMSQEDQTEVIVSLNERPAFTMRFTDRLHQAMANQIALGRLARGPLAEAAELMIAGEPAYDPSALYFVGNSLGHILGGTYVGVSPDVERAVLGVGGANLSLIMFRARPFLPFLAVLSLHAEDPLDQQKFAVFAQSSFDRVDPATYARYVVGERLPDAPEERRVLLQTGVDDSAVTSLSAMFHARALGIPLLEPTPLEVPAIGREGYPADDGFVLFDFGLDLDLAARASPPKEDNEVHDAVRHLPAAKSQLSAFLRPDGELTETCDGVCDPE